MLISSDSFVKRRGSRIGIYVDSPIGFGFGLSDLNIDYEDTEEDYSTFYHSISTCKEILKQIIRESQDFLIEKQISLLIPLNTLQLTMQISEDIILIECLNHDNPEAFILGDEEPIKCILDKWRRADCPTSKIEIEIQKDKDKKKKNNKRTSYSPQQLSPSPPKKNSLFSFDNELSRSRFESKTSQVKEEDEKEEVEVEIKSESIWDKYVVKQIDMSVPVDLDHLEEGLRIQYLYEMEMKIERQKMNAERLEQYNLDQKQFKNINNTLREKKKEFTYDYEGKMLIMTKLSGKKLPSVNPRPQIATHDEEVKMNEQFLTQQEKDKRALKSAIKSQPVQKLKIKPQVKMTLPLKSGLQRYSQSTIVKITKDPAIDIIRQQETNLISGYMDKFQMKPGVSIQVGTNFKSVDPISSLASLPYNAQSMIQSYLSVQQKLPVKLTKHEYENLIGTNSSKLQNNQGNESQLDLGGSVLKDLSQLDSISTVKQSRVNNYSKIYSLKKSNTQQIIATQFDDTIILNGSVKIADVGRFYDLFMKEDDMINVILNTTESLPQIVQTQKVVTKTVKNSRQSKLINKVWGDNPQLAEAKLPFIPLSQLQKHLQQNQSSSGQNFDAQSNSMISQISVISQSPSVKINYTARKMPRDRSQPSIMDRLSSPQFLAAPKIGKTMGYGVNMIYNLSQQS